MNRRLFTAFAKAQAAGLAMGFASALWAVLANGLGVRIFLVAAAGAWLAWEFTLGPRALAYAALTGFAFPWTGFLFAALAAWAAP